MARFGGWSSHGVKRRGRNIDPRTALSGLALVLGLALLAAFYLTLASQTAMLGRRLQEIEAVRAKLVRENARLQEQIAQQASAANLRQRALAAGFVTTGTVVFLPVDPNQLQNAELEQYPP